MSLIKLNILKIRMKLISHVLNFIITKYGIHGTETSSQLPEMTHHLWLFPKQEAIVKWVSFDWHHIIFRDSTLTRLGFMVYG